MWYGYWFVSVEYGIYYEVNCIGYLIGIMNEFGL